VREVLRCAGAGSSDLVQVRSWLTDLGAVDAYVRVRQDVVSHRPAYMLAVAPPLIWPGLRPELGVTAVVTHPASKQDE
jgi:2-iminobutanoate/2-iminopropanoate deaminase